MKVWVVTRDGKSWTLRIFSSRKKAVTYINSRPSWFSGHYNIREKKVR
jgi:hypothetical protein